MANDYFKFKKFVIYQNRCAMKVGTDGTLIGAWARGGGNILDVGTGTGLIALMMAQRFDEARVTGIDIDTDAVGQARENAAASPFAHRLAIELCDVADMEGCFDAIVSNPPFFQQSLRCPDPQRTLARHGDTLSYAQLMEHGCRLLADNGELSVVVPAEGRSRMEGEAALQGLFESRRWAVRTAAHKPPKRWLLAFTRHQQKLELGELTLGTEKAFELTKDFYL